MSAPWSEREDISQQVEEANEAARGEIASQRAEDWVDIYDERQPTREEAERDDFDDWSWWRR